MSDPRAQAVEWLRLYRDLGVEAMALPSPAEAGPAPGDSAVGGAAEALERLRVETLGECQRCALWKGRTRLVFGTGNPEARLLFVGEGPGADEDRIGEPFVGKAGKLLDRIIGAMGLSREEVYIANVVKCRPPGNRAPLPDESATCLPFLHEQIRIIQPEVIVTLGRTALEGLLGEPVRSITRSRGRWFRAAGVPVMATFHPAYLLRNPTAKRPVWEDMQEVLARLGLSPPPRQSG